MANLLNLIREHLTPAYIGQTAATFGESENNVAKALNSLMLTLLAGLAQKAGDAREMDRLFVLLQKFDPAVLDAPGSLPGSGNLARNDPQDEAGHFLGTLFGEKVPALLNGVSAFSGARPSTVSSLLGSAALLVMAMLHRRIADDNLNAAGLSLLLQNERGDIVSALPGNLLALPGLADGNETLPAPATEGLNWLWPLLLLLGLGGGILYYLR